MRPFRLILATCAILALFAGPLAAEQSLQFSVRVEWPTDGGGKAYASLIPILGDASKCWLEVIKSGDKPGDLPIVRRYLVPLVDVGPSPTPNPQPEPKPQPLPIGNAKAVFLIHESKDSTPATAAVRDAKAWKDSLDAAGIKWIVLDQDAGSNGYPNVVAKAKAIGLPAIVIVDANNVAHAEKAPDTPEFMRLRTQQLGGK